jgi:diguanylate cyclase (GGDEF)-like protein/PAS domain S-box-containing protein
MRHRKNHPQARAKTTSPRKQQRLLAAIREIHERHQHSGDAQALFTAVLNAVRDLTDSPYGAAGEIVAGAEDQLEFKPWAGVYPRDANPKRFDALMRQVMSSGRVRAVAKDSRTPRDRGGEPVFPEAFLGLPIHSGGNLVAMVGVANRTHGYDREMGAFLEPLLCGVGTLIQSYRNARQYFDAERERRQALSARKYIETSLRSIATAVSSATGTKYFHSLVKQLSKVLLVDAAFISVLGHDEGDGAEIIALCDRGDVQDHFRHPLNATPCEKIIAKGSRHYLSGLSRKFPRDALIQDRGWESCLGVAVRDASGQVLGVVAVADRKPIAHRQPTEAVLQICASRIAAELEHQRTEAKTHKLSQALEQTADSITITDTNGVIEYINPAFTAMTGFSAREALGHHPSLVKSGRHEAQFYRQLWDALQRGQTFRDVFINRKKGGELYYEEKTITPLKDARGRITHYISTGKDITERMQTQERLHYLSYHDVLTELPNRLLFLEWLNHALAVDGDAGIRLAVICLDVDRFKIINDTLGHDSGDRVLLALAGLLKKCLGKGDTVARFGGDEFAVLIEHFASPSDVMTKINKILERLAHPLHIDSHDLYITVSMGIALAPDDGTDANTLLRNADAALNRAKEQGRHTYQFYSADLSHKASKRLSLETNLYRAIERREFHLCYQPQVDLETGRIMGLEALLRWRHPELGLINPLEFIPLLEDTGLIIPVGEWVLRAACTEAARWQSLTDIPLRLSVNLSGRQFNDPALHKTVGNILAETRLAPSQLELEITESVLMQNDQASMSNLDALQRLRIRIAIDDFGTGYSSLGYLKRFPVDTLKIDRSFIRDVINNHDDKTIIQAIIAMARSLQVDIIAEGVETHGQLEFLRSSGCQSAQGFLLSKPFMADELPRFLEQPIHFV